LITARSTREKNFAGGLPTGLTGLKFDFRVFVNPV
jgi:hypothetical protein